MLVHPQTQLILESLHSEAKVSPADEALERGWRFDDLEGGSVEHSYILQRSSDENVAIHLLEDGQSVNCQKPLRIRHQGTIKRLFRFGAKANTRDYRGCTPLVEAFNIDINMQMKALSSCPIGKIIDYRGRIQLTITTSVLKHCGAEFFSAASQCWNRLS